MIVCFSKPAKYKNSGPSGWGLVIMTFASVDGIGAEKECKVEEKKVIPTSVPIYSALDSRVSTSTTGIFSISSS